MKMVTGGSCAVLLALMMDGHALNAAASCQSLLSLALPNTSITLAQLVPYLNMPTSIPPGSGLAPDRQKSGLHRRRES